MPIAWMIPVGYLMGSIPFGLLIARSRGVDPREGGSGNIGATNVGRLLGRKYFYIVFALDMLKSLVPVAVTGLILAQHARPTLADNVIWLTVAAGALLGHIFPVWLRFKGGKGVATSFGIMVGVFPYYTVAAAAVFVTWMVVFRLTRWVSAASMAAAVMFPMGLFGAGLVQKWPLFNELLPMTVLAILLPVLVIARHRANIARLLAGTEPKAPRRV